MVLAVDCGRGRLALDIGGNRVLADTSGFGGDAPWFRNVVRAADPDSDGVGVPADALMLNGRTIRSPAGSEARLGLGRHANTGGVCKVDASQSMLRQWLAGGSTATCRIPTHQAWERLK